MFLPFICNAELIALSNILLLISFSRGVYLTTVVHWFTKFFPFYRVNKRILKSALLFIGSLWTVWVFLIPPVYKTEIFKWLFSRIIGGESWGATITERISGRTIGDSRWQVYSQALRLLKKTAFQGIGLGGFFWGQTLIGEAAEFSNAHNLYLTVLCEGGVPFFLAVLYLFLKMTSLAWVYSRRALLSLWIFLFYGFFSGQLYEASGLVTACDYHYLLFIYAYLNHLKKQRV